MDSSQIGLLCVLIVLICLSSFFSASETAYSSLNQIRIKQLKKTGNKKAKLAYENAKDFTSLITAILIGNNVVNILATSIATSLFLELYGASGVALATFVMTVVVLIFGEITPKIIAKSKPETMALISARVLYIMRVVFKPLSKVVISIENKLVSGDDDVTATEDELLEIVSTIESEGVLEQNERELIESAIEFDEKSVRDIMVIKDDVIFVYDNATFENLSYILEHYKLSRIPVISYKTTKVVGILRVRDVLDTMLRKEEVIISSLMQKPIFVSQRGRLPQVLQQIQKSRTHMAIVTESQKVKNFVGIVTLEDILEEIVGEIYDEFDPLPHSVFEIGHHTFQVNTDVELEVFFDDYVEEQEYPETDAITIKEWIKELNDNKKLRKNRILNYKNFEMKVLETKDGEAIKVEIDIASYIEEE